MLRSKKNRDSIRIKGIKEDAVFRRGKREIEDIIREENRI